MVTKRLVITTTFLAVKDAKVSGFTYQIVRTIDSCTSAIGLPYQREVDALVSLRPKIYIRVKYMYLMMKSCW